MSTKLCACGECGLPVKPGRTYRRGHNSRSDEQRAQMAAANRTPEARARGARRMTTHGHAARGGSPTYTAWLGMVQRCSYPRHRRFVDFGGKGITVDPRWLGEGGFERFLADMGERPDGLWLGRMDSTGTYNAANAAWMTPEQVKSIEEEVT